MFSRPRRRVVLLASIGVVAVAGSAMAAAGKKGTACDARRGTTVLEDAVARVYKVRGADYACARRSGRVYRLNLGYTQGQSAPDSKVDLAGSYAAWMEVLLTPAGVGPEIARLDLATGTYRRVASYEGEHSEFGDFVVNAHGTVVFIASYDVCLGGSGCEARSAVRSTSAHGNTTLADTTNDSTDPAPAAQIPITTLGLSAAGTVAFWIDNGTYAGASIP